VYAGEPNLVVVMFVCFFFS